MFVEDNSNFDARHRLSERVSDSVDWGLFVWVLTILVAIGQGRVLIEGGDSGVDELSQAAGAEYPVHRQGLYRLPVSPAYSPPMMSAPLRTEGAQPGVSQPDVGPHHEYRVRLSDLADGDDSADYRLGER